MKRGSFLLVLLSFFVTLSPSFPQTRKTASPLGGETWSTGAVLPDGQEGMTSAVVNGKIYVMGGDAGNPSDNQIYDPGTNNWSKGASLPFEEDDMTSAVFEGKIYVFGGNFGGNYQKNQIYDPATDTGPRAPN